jgi:hypothetical protein
LKNGPGHPGFFRDNFIASKGKRASPVQFHGEPPLENRAQRAKTYPHGFSPYTHGGGYKKESHASPNKGINRKMNPCQWLILMDFPHTQNAGGAKQSLTHRPTKGLTEK